jgi:hypothetical protein
MNKNVILFEREEKVQRTCTSMFERRPKPHSNEQEASFADYAKQARVIMKLFFLSLHLTLSAVPFLLAARTEQNN